MKLGIKIFKDRQYYVCKCGHTESTNSITYKCPACGNTNFVIENDIKNKYDYSNKFMTIRQSDFNITVVSYGVKFKLSEDMVMSNVKGNTYVLVYNPKLNKHFIATVNDNNQFVNKIGINEDTLKAFFGMLYGNSLYQAKLAYSEYNRFLPSAISNYLGGYATSTQYLNETYLEKLYKDNMVELMVKENFSPKFIMGYLTDYATRTLYNGKSLIEIMGLSKAVMKYLKKYDEDFLNYHILLKLKLELGNDILLKLITTVETQMNKLNWNDKYKVSPLAFIRLAFNNLGITETNYEEREERGYTRRRRRGTSNQLNNMWVYNVDISSVAKCIINNIEKLATPVVNLDVREEAIQTLHRGSLQQLINEYSTYYKDYLNMNRQLQQLKIEKYPNQLKRDHDFLQERQMLLKEDINLNVYISKVGRKKCIELQAQSNEYAVFIPGTPAAIKLEGIKQHHCVGGYIDSVMKGECLIMFMRTRANMNEPLVTIELKETDTKFQDTNKIMYELIQARGSRNRRLTEQEKAFIKDWAKLKHISLNPYYL